MHGLGSYYSTRKFLKWAESYKPDLLWLHNIHGYYISADFEALRDLFPSSTSIYAKIQLVTVGDNKELSGVDDNDEYQGVVFSDTATSPLLEDTYELRILSRVTSSLILILLTLILLLTVE